MKKLLTIIFLIVASPAFCVVCPVCQSEGKRSTIIVKTCSRTLLETHAYYDEDGNYHYDDPNTTTCEMECSNGHKLVSVDGVVSAAQEEEKDEE